MLYLFILFIPCFRDFLLLHKFNKHRYISYSDRHNTTIKIDTSENFRVVGSVGCLLLGVGCRMPSPVRGWQPPIPNNKRSGKNPPRSLIWYSARLLAVAIGTHKPGGGHLGKASTWPCCRPFLTDPVPILFLALPPARAGTWRGSEAWSRRLYAFSLEWFLRSNSERHASGSYHAVWE